MMCNASHQRATNGQERYGLTGQRKNENVLYGVLRNCRLPRSGTKKMEGLRVSDLFLLELHIIVLAYSVFEFNPVVFVIG